MPSKYQLTFDGDLLQRGFWIYIWKVEDRKTSNLYYYVGRTGDSSSLNASSPFSRLSSHLSKNPKANALLKHLHAQGIAVGECRFDFFSFGPLFFEAFNWEDHKHKRDKTATVEKMVAQSLKERGVTVFGVHQVSQHRFIDSPELRTIVDNIMDDITDNIHDTNK